MMPDIDALNAVYQACEEELYPANLAEGGTYPLISERLFSELYKYMKETIFPQGVNVRQMEFELDKLKKQILDRFLAQGRTVNQAYWEGDFAIFSYFISISLNENHRKLKPNLNVLWPQMDEVQAKQRYNTLIYCLLQQSIPTPTSTTLILKADLTLFNRGVRRYERLMQCFLQDADLVSSSLKESFKLWMQALLTWMQRLLGLKVSSKEPLYQETAERLVNLIKQLNFTKEDLEKHLNVPRAWYEAAAQECEQRPLYIETYISAPDKKWLDSLGWIAKKLVWSQYLTYRLIPDLKKDLKSLEQWGDYCFQKAVHHADEHLMVDAYTEVYERVQTKINLWKGKLLDIRKRMEKELRGDKNYLIHLEKLDNALLKLTDELDGYEESWLNKIEKNTPFHPSVVQAANQYFRLLQSPEVKRLKWVEWVQHSACMMRSTENYMAHEIHIRNDSVNRRYFSHQKDLEYPTEERYLSHYISHVDTMTDFAVRQLHVANRQVRQKIRLQLHPDKCTSISGATTVNGVALYCTKYLNELCTNATQLVELWGRSQWHAMRVGADATDLKPVLSLTDKKQQNAEAEDEECENNPFYDHPEEPKGKLSAGVFLDLHRAYIEHMESSPPGSLQKMAPQNIEAADMLYEGTEDAKSVQKTWKAAKTSALEIHRELKQNRKAFQRFWQSNLLADLEERFLEKEMRLNAEEVIALLNKSINKTLRATPLLDRKEVKTYGYNILVNDVRFSEFKKFVEPSPPYQSKSGQFLANQSTTKLDVQRESPKKEK